VNAINTNNSLIAMKAKKQRGLTLIELIASLTVFALVVGGALALFSSSSSSQASIQMTSDLTAIRAATRGLYYGKGGYGTGNLNAVLVNGNKVPTTMTVTAGTPPTISHGLGGAVTIAGASTAFNITVTAVPTDVCMSVLTSSTGWNSITVGSGTAITAFPVQPDAASTACSAAATQTVVFGSA